MPVRTFDPDAWFPYLIVIFVLGMTSGIFFFVGHVSTKAKQLRSPGNHRTSGLTWNVLIYDLATLLFSPVSFWLALNINETASKCRTISSIFLSINLVFKAIGYRVLVSKAELYDLLDEFTRCAMIVKIALYFIYPIIAVFIISIAVESNYVIKEIDGHRLCVLSDSPEPGAAVGGFLLAITDTIISVLCLYLLSLPLSYALKDENSVEKRKRLGACRNSTCALIAVVSTFGYFVFAAALDAYGSFIQSLVGAVGSMDSLVVIICINLCWPLHYYTSAWGFRNSPRQSARHSGGSFPRSSKKNKQTVSIAVEFKGPSIIGDGPGLVLARRGEEKSTKRLSTWNLHSSASNTQNSPALCNTITTSIEAHTVIDRAESANRAIIDRAESANRAENSNRTENGNNKPVSC
eukprot:CAMPEP_0114507522 /NCGR_PEP_ID=MMETSP0109-20121206/12058_1 /TAXON_ID=29199 /ORGANISM="Chlorarachnion reptans, Strain CCCM449" /LENGTH=406 /DNA_ID=CAMNT_0001686287 /DNA_START=113 /DNA_END=1333 /DNA_ORIENTATION=-